MAGSNPGMVIKVAADIAAAQSAFADVAGEATTTAAAIGELSSAFDAGAMAADLGTAEQAIADIGAAAQTTEQDQASLDQAVTDTATAYGDLGTSAPADLADVKDATDDVDKATGGVPRPASLRLGVTIGTFVADAAMKLAELAGPASAHWRPAWRTSSWKDPTSRTSRRRSTPSRRPSA